MYEGQQSATFFFFFCTEYVVLLKKKYMLGAAGAGSSTQSLISCFVSLSPSLTAAEGNMADDVQPERGQKRRWQEY